MPMDKNIQKIYELLSKNKPDLEYRRRLEDSSDTYPQGYNDALLDVLTIFGEKPEEDSHCQPPRS